MNGEPGFRWVGFRKEHTQAGRPWEVRVPWGPPPRCQTKDRAGRSVKVTVRKLEETHVPAAFS